MARRPALASEPQGSVEERVTESVPEVLGSVALAATLVSSLACTVAENRCGLAGRGAPWPLPMGVRGTGARPT